MSRAVFTRMKRFRFVKGQITDTPDAGFVACGDGRPFSLEVTAATVREKFDILAEFFYRVKDARFTSGYARLEEESYIQYYAPTTAPTNRSFAEAVTYDLVTGTNFLRRGYTTPVENAPKTIPTKNDIYLNEAYDRGDGEMWRDISNKELGIWIPNDENELPEWNTDLECVTAFSMKSEIELASDLFAPNDTNYFQADVGSGFGACFGFVRFSGRVAVVEASPGDGILAPSNRFFVEVELRVENGQILNDFWIATHAEDIGQPPQICCNYVIQLSGERELKCPIYAITSSVFPYGETFSGSDFVHEATEWWPYNSSTGAVWDTATGAKL